MNIPRFKEQLAVLRRLKRRSRRDLARLHKAKFGGTGWDRPVRDWWSKDLLIRRLYYLYCYRNYHYPPNHEITVFFLKKANKFLSEVTERHQEEESRRQLEDLERFSQRNILSMDINTIDRYLAGINMHLEAPEDIRRRALWEYFNLPQTKLIQTNNAQGNRVRRYRRGRINNKYVLRDLVLANPTMNFLSFCATFGSVMPTVTRSSYNTARSLCRKAGYKMQRLKTGPAHPVVVAETTRGRD